MKYIIIIFALLLAPYAFAADIYFASSSAGSNNGTNCANAYAYNDGTHGLGVTGTWTAGNVLHLCGTFTGTAGASSFITAQASGSSGSRITLKFETGAVITATYWTGPVINLNDKSYITVDGGTNGIIQATANGSAFANQGDNGACVNNGMPAGNATDVTVQNLTCSNIYIDSSLSDNGGEDTYGIDIWNTSNLVIQNNTLHDMKWAIRNSYATGSTYSNLTVADNTIYNMDHGWFGGDSSTSGSAVMSNWQIYGNDISNFSNWDNTLDNNHHDGIHLNTNSTTTLFTNVFIYDNYIHGDPGAFGNAGFFSFPAAAAAESGMYIFNNVMVNDSANHCWANGEIALAKVGTSYIFNNTIDSFASTCHDTGIVYEDGSTNGTIENNLVLNSPNDGIYSTATTSVTAINYNDYFGSVAWTYNGSSYSTLASWQATGFDANSITTNPNITAGFALTAGSPAIGLGANLTSLCSTESQICADKAGIARPASGAWDAGAYQFGGSPAPSHGKMIARAGTVLGEVENGELIF